MTSKESTVGVKVSSLGMTSGEGERCHMSFHVFPPYGRVSQGYHLTTGGSNTCKSPVWSRERGRVLIKLHEQGHDPSLHSLLFWRELQGCQLRNTSSASAFSISLSTPSPCIYFLITLYTSLSPYIYLLVTRDSMHSLTVKLFPFLFFFIHFFYCFPVCCSPFCFPPLLGSLSSIATISIINILPFLSILHFLLFSFCWTLFSINLHSVAVWPFQE